MKDVKYISNKIEEINSIHNITLHKNFIQNKKYLSQKREDKTMMKM